MLHDYLDEVIGHSSVKKLLTLFERGHFFSLVLYGPPGCGKSLLISKLIEWLQNEKRIDYFKFSPDKAFSSLKEALGYFKVIWIEEIHRLSKDKQDILLLPIERGTILFATTTMSPVRYLQPALRSRLKIFKLRRLSEVELMEIGRRYLRMLLGESRKQDFERYVELLPAFCEASFGDARTLKGWLELAVNMEEPEKILESLSIETPGLARSEKVSAFIKSIRACKVDSALFYLALLLEEGVDWRYVSRRLLISAVEDVGLAHPEAIAVVKAALDAAEEVGMPEAVIHLGFCVVYLSILPKSNASYKAVKEAIRYVRENKKQLVGFKVPRNLVSGTGEYVNPHFDLKGLHLNYFKNEKFYRPKSMWERKCIENNPWLNEKD